MCLNILYELNEQHLTGPSLKARSPRRNMIGRRRRNQAVGIQGRQGPSRAGGQGRRQGRTRRRRAVGGIKRRRRRMEAGGRRSESEIGRGRTGRRRRRRGEQRRSRRED